MLACLMMRCNCEMCNFVTSKNEYNLFLIKEKHRNMLRKKVKKSLIINPHVIIFLWSSYQATQLKKVKKWLPFSLFKTWLVWGDNINDKWKNTSCLYRKHLIIFALGMGRRPYIERDCEEELIWKCARFHEIIFRAKNY
jgi:hypothetical protein